MSFSNTSGGELIVGVDDNDLSVFGIKESRSTFEQKVVETIYNKSDCYCTFNYALEISLNIFLISFVTCFLL